MPTPIQFSAHISYSDGEGTDVFMPSNKVAYTSAEPNGDYVLAMSDRPGDRMIYIRFDRASLLPLVNDIIEAMLATAGMLILVSTLGCSSPTRPAPVAPARPEHHNIPVTAPDGSIWFVCETAPRQYSTGVERDHYLQREPCPADPIS